MEDTINHTCFQCQCVTQFTVNDNGYFCCDNCFCIADDIVDTGFSEEFQDLYRCSATRSQDAAGFTITDGDYSDSDSCCSQTDDIGDTAFSFPRGVHQTNRSAARSNKQRDITSDESSELKHPDVSVLNSSPDMPSNSLNHSGSLLAAMIKSVTRRRELNAKASSSRHNKAPEETPCHTKSSS